MQDDDFSLSSDDAKLLLTLKRHTTLEQLSIVYRRDPSVISRRLKEIAAKEAVLIKEEGQWKLTPLGEEFANWAHESIQTQKRIIQKRQLIRIATTREFASLILAPNIAQLIDLTKYRVEIIASDEGVEKALLADKADIGFDCGAPYNPDIAFKSVAPEEMGLVASPAFLKAKGERFYEKDDEYIHFFRNDMKIFFELTQTNSIPKVTCHDIATARSLALAGLGWSYLPYYTVSNLVKKKKLVYLPHPLIRNLKFGIWWPRQNKRFEDIIAESASWLKGVDLKRID